MHIPVHTGEKKNAPIIQKEKDWIQIAFKEGLWSLQRYNQLTDGVTLRQEPPLQGYFEKISTFAAHSSRTQVVFFQNFLTPSAQPIKIKGNNHKPL